MISLEKLLILILLQKLPKNVGDLGKPIVATCLEKLPKVQKIAQSGHTDDSGQCWCSTMAIIYHLWRALLN